MVSGTLTSRTAPEKGMGERVAEADGRVTLALALRVTLAVAEGRTVRDLVAERDSERLAVEVRVCVALAVKLRVAVALRVGVREAVLVGVRPRVCVVVRVTEEELVTAAVVLAVILPERVGAAVCVELEE